MRKIVSLLLLGGVAACTASLENFSEPEEDSGTPPVGQCSANPFTASVCSCTDILVAGYISTSSDPANPTAGGIGANGRIAAEGYLTTTGSVRAAGASSLAFRGLLQAGRDLESAASIAGVGTTAGYLKVKGSASVGGDISLLGYAQIGGDLTQPEGSSAPTVLDVGGTRRFAPVDVAPPCDCNQGPDLESRVAAGRDDNDNASIGLDPASLTQLAAVREIVLPDGTYYVDEVSGTGSIKLRVTGNTTLLVGGDVDNTGFLNVEVDPGARFDLVIGGNLNSIGATFLGPLDRPGSSRVFVAGSGTITLVGASAFAANVYAPNAAIRATGATIVRGSLFGRAIEIPGYLDVGYDSTVQGENCDPVLL